MRTLTIRHLATCLILGVLSALVAVPSYAADARQTNLGGEPNNNFGRATAIAVGAAVEGTIAPTGDQDWYRFVVNQQGELEIAVTNVAPELAISVRVWNANKNTVSGWVAPLATGGETRGIVDLAAPGDYFLEVVNDASDVESSQPYQLLLNFTPTADTGEPNNVFGRATPIEFDQTVMANMLPANDTDWYSVEVDWQGELRIDITDVDPEMAVSVRVWNSNKSTISGWVAPLAAGGDTRGYVDLPEAGRYFLEVVASDDVRSTQPYALLLTFTEAADRGEPNQEFGDAAPFTLGTSVAANMLPANDTDWYRVDVDHHGELRIGVTDVPEGMAISVRVWNSDKQTVSGWLSPLAAGGDTIGTVDLAWAGTYYLEFVEAEDRRSPEPFTISLGFVAAADPYENNQTFGTATDLPLGQSQPSNILPAGDNDWHRVVVDHQGELQVSATDVPENLAISVRVWNSDKQTISSWFAPLAAGGDTTAVVDLPEAGEYYLEVVDDSNDARAIDDFLLQARFLPAADQGEPNNTRETAAPIDLDTTIPGNILPANDADWCVFELPETGELHVLITNVAPTLELAMRLWNGEGETVSSWIYPLAAGGDTVAAFPITEPGTYYLEVVDNARGRSIQPYLLRFSMEEIDPAEMTFTQSVTATDTLTDTETAVVAGTEIVTVTTTTVTTTVTVRASGEVDESEIVTATEALTTTDVVTRAATSDDDATGVDVEATDAPDSAPESATDDTSGAASNEASDDASEQEGSTGPSTNAPPPPAAPAAPADDAETEENAAEDEPADDEAGSAPPPTTSATNESTTTEPSATEPVASASAVAVVDARVDVPEGWHANAETGAFRGVALLPEDLSAGAPAGPRLWVVGPGEADFALAGTLEPGGTANRVVEEATTVQVGALEAIAFGVQSEVAGESVMRRYVFVNTGAGESYEFILEAPLEQWETHAATLEEVLASVVIEIE